MTVIGSYLEFQWRRMIFLALVWIYGASINLLSHYIFFLNVHETTCWPIILQSFIKPKEWGRHSLPVTRTWTTSIEKGTRTHRHTHGQTQKETKREIEKGVEIVTSITVNLYVQQISPPPPCANHHNQVVIVLFIFYAISAGFVVVVELVRKLCLNRMIK